MNKIKSAAGFVCWYLSAGIFGIAIGLLFVNFLLVLSGSAPTWPFAAGKPDLGQQTEAKIERR